VSSPEIPETELSAPTILPLDEALRAPTGGKAEGLARLIALGLRVPPGFVVRGLSAGTLPSGVRQAYRALGGGPVAVRSSASDEDGALASFAGQFESSLGVEGEDALQQAIGRCLASLESARALRYRRDREQVGGAATMNVVIQQMVRARAAGVLFTVDPLSGEPALLVDAVPGLGEALVSGRASSDHYRLGRDGSLRHFEPRAEGAAPLLDAETLGELCAGALRAEAETGAPLDLEWAIDEQGLLYWLQARPITALPIREPGIEAPDPDEGELDTRAREGEVYTRANVGEMLPGAQTPLTLSTTVLAVDQGIQRMLVECVAGARRVPELRTLGVFHGHLFFNLSAMLEFTRNVGGSNPEALTFAICGRRIPELVSPPPASPITRARNGARYLRFVLGGAGEVARLERALPGFRIGERASAAELFAEIDRQLPFLHEVFAIHLQASASSGLTHGALHGVLARGGVPTPEHEAMLASLLEDAGGVESAEMVRELDRVRDAIRRAPDARAGFVEVAVDEAETWLRSSGSGEAGIAYASFLSRHGHRAARELAIEQPGWRDDPRPLLLSLQAALQAPGAAARPRPRRDRPLPRQGLAMRGLVAWARRSIRQRERSKSLLIQTCDHFKRAYRRLARALVADGLLPEESDLFFLLHAELGRLVTSRDPALATLARRRRARHRRQQALSFSDVFVGKPDPLPEPGESAGDEVLQGRPVSRGIARGPARVVLDLEGARAIRAGEILIAPITDVGWSPYFHLIAGLATDVGSAISHGAVVAREYGLPAVVNLRVASRVIRTGEQVVLDGERGTLRREGPGDPRPDQ
jgi:pyruvate,water dikinase